uniref:Uncharacterized protein n=1 Tax=Romanomermis culicivorax TaxID=13658 RepID=A0A915JCM6_ROMCU
MKKGKKKQDRESSKEERRNNVKKNKKRKNLDNNRKRQRTTAVAPAQAAPTPKPAIPCSHNGVLNTLSEPYKNNFLNPYLQSTTENATKSHVFAKNNCKRKMHRIRNSGSKHA